MTVSIENLQYLLWYCYDLSSFSFDMSIQKNVANMLKKLLLRKLRKSFYLQKKRCSYFMANFNN